MQTPRTTTPILQALAGLFYSSQEELGVFQELGSPDVPQPYRQLLAHHKHMTVSVEAHHKSPVDVQVLAVSRDNDHYSRKILLSRKSDGRVVQFGIVRLHLPFLDEAVRHEIEQESTPLGRILIEHNVMREVELSTLWRVQPGEELQELLGMEPDHITYGRTALIYCDRLPAVELLEIVTEEEG